MVRPGGGSVAHARQSWPVPCIGSVPSAASKEEKYEIGEIAVDFVHGVYDRNPRWMFSGIEIARCFRRPAQSLDQAGLKSVSISQDRDKGVVVLGGHVPSEGDKSQADSIAKSIAGDQVVSDQILVIPPGAESDTKAMNSDLDRGIANNLDAALIQNTLQKNVKYDVKNGVVTLTGAVDSQPRATQAGTIASSVPNVLQVVNEVQVKDQKASSSPSL